MHEHLRAWKVSQDQRNRSAYLHRIPLLWQHDQLTLSEVFQKWYQEEHALQKDMSHYNPDKSDWRYIYSFMVMSLSCLTTTINSFQAWIVYRNLTPKQRLHRLFLLHYEVL